MSTTTSKDDPQIRAWTYTTGGYPSCLTLSSIPAPTLPPPPADGKGTHVVIRTTAAALNPVDIQLMNFPLFTPSKLPFPLSSLFSFWPLNALSTRRKGVGADFAGVVVAAHEGAGFAVGDRVFGLAFTPGAERGTLSEALLLDTQADVVVRVPSSWSDVMAASVPLVALTARTCVERCVGYVGASASSSSSTNDASNTGSTQANGSSSNNTPTLAVLGGSSATGLYTTLLASARGWRVVATCSAPKAALVRRMGAAETIDYTTHSSAASLRGAVAAFRPSAIVDCVGGTALLHLPGVRRYVTIVGDKTSRGVMGGAATYAWSPRMALRALASSNSSNDNTSWWVWQPLRQLGWLVGVAGADEYACVNLETRADWLGEFVDVVGEEERDKVVVDSVFKFEHVRQAFERLDGGRCAGKVVVSVP